MHFRIRNRLLAAAVGALGLIGISANAEAQPLMVNPTISSISDNRFTIIAKDVGTAALKVRDWTHYVTNDDLGETWNVQGWTDIPSSTDSTAPDSSAITCRTGVLNAAGNKATMVVTRRSNGTVVYALRGAPVGAGTFTVFPAWTGWTSTGGTGLVGAPSTAFYPTSTNPNTATCNGMLFSRHSSGAIYHTEYNVATPGNFDGWHALVASPTDFVSDPDAVATPNGAKVCARRSTGLMWCATRTPGVPNSWVWTAVEQQWPVSSGPGLGAMLNGGNDYEVYASGSDFNVWSNVKTNGVWGGWNMIPHGSSNADPDAAVFYDAVYGASTRVIVTSDTYNHTGLMMYNPLHGLTNWFTP